MNQNSDIHFEMRGDIAVIRLTRPTKRNALNDALIASLRHIFENLPDNAKAAVIAGDGDHFCAGLDLSDLKEVFYDILVFFSPADIKSLYDNFPDFIQNKTRIAGFGASTQAAIAEHNLILDITAPAPGIPSMVAALEDYVSRCSK